MGKKPKKAKALAVRVPQTMQEAEELLAEIGRLQREVGTIERDMNDELAQVKQDYSDDAAPINAQIDEDFAALHTWAEANREELLKHGGKTAKLATGELSWRVTPPSVRVTGAAVVLKTLRRLGLARFIRTKEEIDKTAILSEPEAVQGVKGISISQHEEFVAKPFESEIEKAAVTAPVPKSAGGARAAGLVAVALMCFALVGGCASAQRIGRAALDCAEPQLASAAAAAVPAVIDALTGPTADWSQALDRLVLGLGSAGVCAVMQAIAELEAAPPAKAPPGAAMVAHYAGPDARALQLARARRWASTNGLLDQGAVELGGAAGESR